MGEWRSLLIALSGLSWLSVAPLVGAEIQGSVRCGDRCADFVVYLDGVGGSYDGGGRVVEFGQKNKVFIPHVLPLLNGSTLRVGNDDPFLHNVHARKDGRTVFNFNILFQYQTVDQIITEAGIYRVSCEPHPEMSAVIVVLDNPFFTQPDEAGRFEIADAPPGAYEVVSLDAERGRRRSRRVTVAQARVTVGF